MTAYPARTRIVALGAALTLLGCAHSNPLRSSSGPLEVRARILRSKSVDVSLPKFEILLHNSQKSREPVCEVYVGGAKQNVLRFGCIQPGETTPFHVSRSGVLSLWVRTESGVTENIELDVEDARIQLEVEY